MPIDRKFKVGSRVRLRKDSKYWGQSGDSVGTVTRHRDSYDHYYSVKWDNARTNCYRDRDLIYTSIIYSEDHLKDKDVL